jgi:hypothetical protein
MKNPPFIESGYCRSRAYCHICQGTKPSDVAMRNEWSKTKELPTPITVDGIEVPVCPYGMKPNCDPVVDDQKVRREKFEKSQLQAIPGAWERLRKGAVGLTKVALGVDRAEDSLISQRRKVCEACEHLKGGTCVLCGCWYSQKVKLAGEQCPDEPPRW